MQRRHRPAAIVRRRAVIYERLVRLQKLLRQKPNV
jgi:hypothetical protein